MGLSLLYIYFVAFCAYSKSKIWQTLLLLLFYVIQRAFLRCLKLSSMVIWCAMLIQMQQPQIQIKSIALQNLMLEARKFQPQHLVLLIIIDSVVSWIMIVPVQNFHPGDLYYQSHLTLIFLEMSLHIDPSVSIYFLVVSCQALIAALELVMSSGYRLMIACQL